MSMMQTNTVLLSFNNAKLNIFSFRLADGAIPQRCGPQRPGERLSCPSPVVRSPCRETLTAVFGTSPGPPLSPVLLHIQTIRNTKHKQHDAQTHKTAILSIRQNDRILEYD